MERWLNEEIQDLILNARNISLLNPYNNSGYISEAEKSKKHQLRDENARLKINNIVTEVEKELFRIGNLESKLTEEKEAFGV